MWCPYKVKDIGILEKCSVVPLVPELANLAKTTTTGSTFFVL